MQQEFQEEEGADNQEYDSKEDIAVYERKLGHVLYVTSTSALKILVQADRIEQYLVKKKNLIEQHK